MRLAVNLSGLVRMMFGLDAMAMRDMRMMAGEMMIAIFVMLGGFAMVLGGLLVMIGSGLMMLGFAQSAHFSLPFLSGFYRRRSLPRPNAGAVTFG